MNDSVDMEEFGQALTDAQQEFLKKADIAVTFSRQHAFRQVSKAQTIMAYMIGYWLVELKQGGHTRAAYGERLLKRLSDGLTQAHGRGFSVDTLENMRRFYAAYSDRISETLFREFMEAKSETTFRKLMEQAGFVLPWSHYLKLLQISDRQARLWYEQEASREGWDVRSLQRNLSSQYYERLLLSRDPAPVRDEMRLLTAENQANAMSFVRNPYILEFLDLHEVASATESTLESALITNLSRFLMELGKGYAFVARQQHIRTEKEDYYIDLVFYNYILKCFVLIDLKIGKINYQDAGQMDMYVRMYDERKRSPNDNPTLGIILCSDTDEDIARYSVLHGNEKLFAAKYKLYLPTEEQLRQEIETQKRVFYLQHPELKGE